jgi:hypothetical protein
VAHTCNPRYSGGGDQEYCGSKPVQANSSVRPYLEEPFTKKIGLVEWLKVKVLSSSPSNCKKKKKKEQKIRKYLLSHILFDNHLVDIFQPFLMLIMLLCLCWLYSFAFLFT